MLRPRYRPAIRIDYDRMRAFVVGAIDPPTRAGFPHFAESDFLFAVHRITVKATAPVRWASEAV